MNRSRRTDLFGALLALFVFTFLLESSWEGLRYAKYLLPFAALLATSGASRMEPGSRLQRSLFSPLLRIVGRKRLKFDGKPGLHQALNPLGEFENRHLMRISDVHREPLVRPR